MPEGKVVTVYLIEPALRKLINVVSKEMLLGINHGHVDIELGSLLNQLAKELHDIQEERAVSGQP